MAKSHPLSGDTAFLYSFGNFGIRPGLENTVALLAKLNNPHKHPQIIHIAGTNGKGTTLIVLEQLLLASGYTVGATVSPHLIRLNERFRLNGKEIDDDTLWELLCQIYDACGITHENKDDPEQWEIRPTFFEMIIIAAWMWFQRQKPDFVILETGMGGRLDATNVADSMLQIITPVSYDHEMYLGETLEKIADEKAGIMKPGKTVIIGKQQPQILERLRSQAHEKNLTVYEFNRHIRYQTRSGNNICYHIDIGGNHQTVNVASPALKGAHQLDNISVSLLAYYLLCESEKRQSETMINGLLQNIHFKGRLNKISRRPPIICDGAHNTEGMRALISYLEECFSGKKLLVALTRMHDKQFEKVFTENNTLDITFQPLNISSGRALSGEEMAHALKHTGKQIYPPQSVPEFVKKLINCQSQQFKNIYDAVIVCGSFYLLGEFYDCFERAKASQNLANYHFTNTNV